MADIPAWAQPVIKSSAPRGNANLTPDQKTSAITDLYGADVTPAPAPGSVPAWAQAPAAPPAPAPVNAPVQPQAAALAPANVTPQPPAQEGPIAELGRREGDILSGSLIKDAGQQLTKPYEQDSTAGPPWLQRIGDLGGRVGSIATDVIGSALSPVEAGVKTTLNRTLPDQIKGDAREKLVQDIGDVGTAALLAPTAIGKAGKAATIAKEMEELKTAAPVAEKVAEAPKPMSRPDIEKEMADIEAQMDKGTLPPEEAKTRMDTLANQWLHPEEAAVNNLEKPVWAPAAEEKPSLGTSLRNIASPTSSGPGALDMETNIRQETGLANRHTAIAEANLDKSSKLAANMSPQQQLDYYNYMEGRSKGATLADPALKAFADDTRQVFQDTRKEIESLPDTEKMGFYEDYFPHMWENPDKARQFVGNFIGKQGSNAALKKRQIPTIEEGLAAGLKLKDPNPVRAASKYVTSMNNYIASKKIIDEAKRVGDAGYFAMGRQPENWVPLTGRFAEKPGMMTMTETSDRFSPPKKLYAPPDVARVYNNYYSSGFEGTALAHPYEAMRKVTAANTAAELALSAYHATTITAQSVFNDLGRIFKNAARRDWIGVAKAAKSVTAGQIPFVKGSNYKIGSKLIDQYKGLADHGIDMEAITDHFARGGGKLGQDKLYKAGNEKGIIRSAMAGELKDIGRTFTESSDGHLKNALKVMGNTINDVSYPLFEHYIPRVKAGAFSELMSDWLRQNPMATEKNISAARKRYVDLVDDRFGEMNMDNIFWPKLQKQMLSLFLRAQGWDIGLVRQAGGGILDTGRIMNDIIHRRSFDEALLDRPAFLAAAITGTGMLNAAYQYLKTGKPPEEMLDYMVPQTGGQSASGAPERVMLPGHGRELIQMMSPTPGEGPLSGVTRELSNKVASFPRNLYEAYENQDYRGDPIGETSGEGGWSASLLPRAGHIAEGFLPFSLGSQGAPLEGSNLNTTERRLFGMRPAGMHFTDQERLENIIEKKQRQAWKTKMKHDARAEGQIKQ